MLDRDRRDKVFDGEEYHPKSEALALSSAADYIECCYDPGGYGCRLDFIGW